MPILWRYQRIFCIQSAISSFMIRLPRSCFREIWDPIAKILFSGDMGASMVDDAAKPLENFRLWVNMVRGMDIEMIVPQHGTPFMGKEQITQFLDWIETLQCGTDLMDETVFTCPE